MLFLFIRCNNNHIVNDSKIENKELISVIKRFINETKNTQIYSDSKFIKLDIYNDKYVCIEYIALFELYKIVNSCDIICQKIGGKRILIKPSFYDCISPNHDKILELIKSEYPDYMDNLSDTMKEGRYITPSLMCYFDDNMKLID